MWLAVQEGGTLGFRKKVALKLVRPGKEDDDDETQAFLREASLVANLRHPNIVDTLSVSQEGGTLHIAMEFVDGGTLHDLVNRCLRFGLALPNSVVCSLLIDICRGLAAAHEAEDVDGHPLKVIHRDLKLGNVLLDKTGVAKVADFGMAKAAGDMTATATGFVKGTPAYVAPEVWEGAREFTPGVDLFAVGCIAYSLVTRKRLFDGENVASIYGQICKRSPEQESAPVGDKYPGLAPITEKLLQRDPADRYQRAKDVADDLLELLRRTPAAGEIHDFLWLLDRIEAYESDVDAEDETHGAAPFKIPEQTEAGWAVAIERALGQSVGVLPLATSGGAVELPTPERPPSNKPVQLTAPQASAVEGPPPTPPTPPPKSGEVLRTQLLPPRDSEGAGERTSMNVELALKADKSARIEARKRKQRVVQSRRRLQMVILVLVGVLAVIGGLILGREDTEEGAGESAEQGEPAAVPDLMIVRDDGEEASGEASPDPASGEAAGEEPADASPEAGSSEEAEGTPGADADAADAEPEATPADGDAPGEDAEAAGEDAEAPAEEGEAAPDGEAAGDGGSETEDPAAETEATPAEAGSTDACVVVSASPRGAKVWIDGALNDRSAGSPFGVVVPAGEHRVQMGMVSTPSVEQTVTIGGGEAKSVHCTLTGEAGCRTAAADIAACGL